MLDLGVPLNSIDSTAIVAVIATTNRIAGLPYYSHDHVADYAAIRALTRE